MRPIPITHFLRSAAMKGFFSPAFLSALCLLASSLTCCKHNQTSPVRHGRDAPPTLAATGTGASQAVLSLPRSASRPCPHEPVLVCSLCPGSFPKLPQHLTNTARHTKHKTTTTDLYRRPAPVFPYPGAAQGSLWLLSATPSHQLAYPRKRCQDPPPKENPK